MRDHLVSKNLTRKKPKQEFLLTRLTERVCERSWTCVLIQPRTASRDHHQCASSVNVDKAIDIGIRQMKEFEKKLQDGFYDSIPMKVETMAATKKSLKVGDSKVYNTELIYSRVIGLQASSRGVSINDVMSCELSPVPTALWRDANF